MDAWRKGELQCFHCAEKLFLTNQTLKIKTHALISGASATNVHPATKCGSRRADLRKSNIFKGFWVTMERQQSHSNVWEE